MPVSEDSGIIDGLALNPSDALTISAPTEREEGTMRQVTVLSEETHVNVQDMITEIRANFDISDEEALYIKQVTEEKSADPIIRGTVHRHREDRFYLDGAYRGQVNGEIQGAYDERGRYEELSDPNTLTPAASSPSWRSPSSNTTCRP